MYKIILYKNLDKLDQYLEEAIFNHIKGDSIEHFESLKNICLISFDWYNPVESLGGPSRLVIYFSEDDLFFVCKDETLLDKVNSIFVESPEKDKTLFDFFRALIKPDMEYLDKLEDEIDNLEDNLLIHAQTKCANSIVMYRKKLMKIKKYYKQLSIIFENMVQNENNFISAKYIRHFVILNNRINTLLGMVFDLRDLITHLREAYQAQIDIEQNAIMRIFTVIAAIFLPLTLIAGWYGMNLKMPEVGWVYGYPAVIALSVTVCVTCIAIFKRKKWF
ncbi:MAG: CorA family divalent cation transporter [Anaerovoracaceae bacterium]